MRLRKVGRYTGRMHVKVKFLNAPSWENETRFMETQDTLDLLHALESLWSAFSPRKSARLLQVGVTLLDLSVTAQHTARLFEPADERKKLNATIDALNLRYGKHAAYFGGAHRALDHGKIAIAFNHIPDVDTEK
jgi:DNA polymerase-4